MPTILRVILYPIFAVFCLLIFTLFLFPFDGVRSRVAHEIETQMGGDYSISIGGIAPSFLMGISLKDFEIRSRAVPAREPVKISRVKLHFSLFSLLSGGVSVDFDVRSGLGRATGNYHQRRSGLSLDFKLDKFDLRIPGLMAQKVGFTLSGIASGKGKMDLYNQDPLKNTGAVSLEIPDLKLGEMNFGEALQIPALVLAKTGAAPAKIDAQIERGNIDVKSFSFAGGDLELSADGKVYGARRLDNYRLNMKGSFKVVPEIAGKVPILGLVEKQKTADGSYPLTVTGRVSKPSIRIGEFKIPI